MIHITDNREAMGEGVSRVSKACAVKVWNDRTQVVAFGPSVDEAYSNYVDVGRGEDALYRARQTAYIRGG